VNVIHRTESAATVVVGQLLTALQKFGWKLTHETTKYENFNYERVVVAANGSVLVVHPQTQARLPDICELLKSTICA
jgi:hypothetical protein